MTLGNDGITKSRRQWRGNNPWLGCVSPVLCEVQLGTLLSAKLSLVTDSRIILLIYKNISIFDIPECFKL